ncbi:MAG TPA: Na+/H+ antiporter NhaA [Acidiferrobacter sp.]|nr:Na+/H+ antiporter NhaA [Acidiferrobacter sp.]
MSSPDDLKVSRAIIGALVLLLSAVLALVAANSPYGPAYHRFWHLPHVFAPGLRMTARAIVNNGLMTLFFLAVGLELKREVTQGALRHPRAMALPLVAALGGMIVPAILYYALNRRGIAAGGWGVPMSTDIAFAAGALALLGRRAPRNLMIFLLALAIVDDLGAILVIAFYYTRDLNPPALGWAFAVCAALVFLNRRRVRGLFPYLFLGVLLWWALWCANIDAPLAGAIVAATIPASRPPVVPEGRPWTAADRLGRRLDPYIRLGVMPLFAFANAGLVFSTHNITAQPTVFFGVLLGLVLGKFIGVGGISWLALRFELVHLPTGVAFRHLLGAAWLSGIGFTMALFINALAFAPGAERTAGQFGVLAASALAAMLGMVWLWQTAPRSP